MAFLAESDKDNSETRAWRILGEVKEIPGSRDGSGGRERRRSG